MVQIKSFLVSALVLFSVLASARAENQSVHSVSVYVDLEKDGTAAILERWKVNTGDRITEWYLVRENLGDITIDQFAVTADDIRLSDDGEWDVNRTREQKAGKYGMVHKKNGVELCWGIGEYGEHVYDVFYRMHGAVKSLRDYDMLHLQLVSPGLSSPPEKVRVFIASELVQLDTTVARAWGFGYEGICIFKDGRVLMEGAGPFGTEDSVIALLRLEKGILEPTSVQDRDFREALDRAMEGADFGSDEDEDTAGKVIMGFLTGFFLLIWGIRRKLKKRKEQPAYLIKKLLGVKEKDIPWYRDIPFKGDLPAAKYALEMLGEKKYDTTPLTSALILRMVYGGYLEVNRLLEKQDTELRFTQKDPSSLDFLSKGLYTMMEEAAGENRILEKKEFYKWARSNDSKVHGWAETALEQGKSALYSNGWQGAVSDTFSESGKEEARHLLGLRRFLKEFTFTSEREAFDANLWKEYLVYGAILGIAEIVARQLKEIAPEFGNVDSAITLSSDFSGIVRTAYFHYENRSSSSSTSSSSSYSSYSSRHGYGGRSSRSGGRGYSGGGRGGGGR